jgi:LysR family transcriptional regulator, glycine cleavage system transcriptional activator
MTSPLPPLRLLTVFETVLRRGSVRDAAMELNVSQPAISQSLRQLEIHVGTPLLDRATRPATLTAAGRILQTAALDGLGRISDAIANIKRLQNADDGAVTIACSVGFATYWLMPRLAGFYAGHPEIAVNVHTTHHGAPRMMPGIDIAVRYGDGEWTDGKVTKLFDERVTPVCTSLLKSRLGAEGIDLDRAPLLHVNADDTDWMTWAHYLQACGYAPNLTRGRQFTNYVQATQAALDGQGVMLGWKSITGALVSEGKLVEFNDRPMTPQNSYFGVAAPALKNAADLLLAWLQRTAAMSKSIDASAKT